MTQPPDPNIQQQPGGYPPQPDAFPPPPGMPPPQQGMPPPQQGMPQPGMAPPQPGMGAPPPQAGYYPPAPPVPMSAYGQPNVAVLPGMYYDPNSGLQLPDQTELASVGRRIGAYFLAIPLIIVTLGIGYLIWGLIVWGQGQTPALQVLGCRCWRTETNRIADWGWMALREVVGGIIEGIWIIGLVSFILMCTRGDRRTIHDLIAGTIVLHDPNKVLVPGRQ
jgi:uncharacterized RDD family membrane protein YckC